MTSRTSITADELYLGSGVLSGANPDNRKGVRTVPIVYLDWGAIAAALADGMISGATSTELPATAGTVTYDASTDGTGPQDGTTRPAKTTITVSGVEYPVLDLGAAVAAGKALSPRNIVTVVTHSSSVVAMTVKHYGFDINNRLMTETHSVTAGTASRTVTGKKAFRYWWKTDLTVAADATANTVNVGTGNVFGFPARALVKGAAIAFKDGVAASGAKVVADVTSPATSSTGDVRGTVILDPNGTAEYTLWLAVPDVSTAVIIHGVAQA